MKIAKDTVVSLSYELIDVNGGAVLEKSGDPISYVHGGYDGIFPTVEEELQGKNVGDKVSVIMQPEDAFGEYEHELVRVEPRDLFPKDIEVGMQIEGGAEGDDDEDYMLFTVTEITAKEVTVDGNHPLAGKTLTFNATVTGVRAGTKDELSHGHVHGAGGHHH